MSKQISSIKKVARAYLIALAISVTFIIFAGVSTDYPTLGPIFAVIGLGAALVVNVLAVFVIPIKALLLDE